MSYDKTFKIHIARKSVAMYQRCLELERDGRITSLFFLYRNKHFGVQLLIFLNGTLSGQQFVPRIVCLSHKQEKFRAIVLNNLFNHIST